MQGQLILAANSIGDDRDVPKRTLEAICSSDLLVFEEDRHARKLLKLAGVHRDYLKHNEHDSKDTNALVRASLIDGQTVLYVSDQGCSGIADPGRGLVVIANEVNARIKIIPGPSSITSAISASPFDCTSFDFVGLLPREESQRNKKLELLKSKKVSQVIIDAPYRLSSLIKSCSSVFEKNRIALLAIDITGEDENYIVGNFSELSKYVSALDKKLNFVLVISASS